MKGLIEKGLQPTALFVGWLLMLGLAAVTVLYDAPPFIRPWPQPLLAGCCAFLALWTLAVIVRKLFVAVRGRTLSPVRSLFFLVGTLLIALSLGVHTWVAAKETVHLSTHAQVDLQAKAFAGHQLIREGQTLIFATPEQVRWHQSAEAGSTWSVDDFRGIVEAEKGQGISVQVSRVGAVMPYRLGLLLLIVGGVPLWLRGFRRQHRA